ncbi:armadillo repeat-containing protein 1-like [Acanthaster planci]|uniref:Armadillo repeat-containing protein 1 n=1 Tax=Acanthaster planci TaxID=133434 RepID=A0A8B7Y8W7_ACAPL|nr:armadillo repeat-containing protein 1-like [Acanthaster planci]XP_022089679.1 armadillo repeat-containing protein 1-like [Acanthaster planci]
MDVCAVVKQLRELASDPKNRDAIVKDQGCLPGLVLFLDNDNIDVVVAALETLQLLADCPSNCPIMKKELGMLISLQDIMDKSKYSLRAQNLARDIHDRLTTPPSPSPLKETQNTTQHRPVPKCKENKAFFLGSTNRKGKVVTLQLNGLNDQEQRKACEDELLKVKGVISFTFDLFRKRCILRTKAELKPELLIAAVARTETMSAKQVLKNEFGEEVLLSFGADPATADKENASRPDYLPEDDSPVRGLDKAVVRQGKAEQQPKTSWLSTAASFISTSFYW